MKWNTGVATLTVVVMSSRDLVFVQGEQNGTATLIAFDADNHGKEWQLRHEGFLAHF